MKSSNSKTKKGRLANLRPPFQSGVSGNPKGRPPDPQILKNLRAMCKAADKAGVIFDLLLKEAKKGNVKAIEMMAHYGAGKPADTVHQTTENHESFLRRLIEKEKLKNEYGEVIREKVG